MRPDVTITGGKNVSVGYRSLAGADGVGWTTGGGVPTADLPDGSLYLDEWTGNYYKRTSAAWVLRGSLQAGAGGFNPHQLVALAMEGGPFEGFPTAYREITYSGGYVRNITWYVDATKAAKIVEGDITYTGVNATREVWKAYGSDGVTVLAMATDTVTFSGAYEVSRNRVMS